MTSAQDVLDHIVGAAEADAFGAHAAHVLIGDDSAVHHWSPDVRRDIHSVAKAVCVIAAGTASDAGLYDVDAPVARYLPDSTLGRGVDRVTTRHLLTMTSGIELPWTATLMTHWPDLAHEFLARPSTGRVFHYSNASTYTAMRALAAVVGDVPDWLRPRLFEPLGIIDPPWDRCPNGRIVAGEGLHLRAEELARLGRLIRDDGRWHGRRLLSSRWTHSMRADWVEHDAPPAYARYSLAAWGGPGDAWRLHGAHGQLVIFRGDSVVTVTAADHVGADRMAERVVAILGALGSRTTG
ncbi:serine hydrolase domain-containing protein [Nocardioides sp. AX2bis]|uniref:serine hydrolase domain-containing protein n=1 Tax=Nocardioides sp. AX2bis TaxID=2653157 RepID=UPI0012EF5EF4|nr:serine hydrolase [Nocardioides sp. AX2bis]VXB10428.1 Class C beta-lactamase-related serine hydrolase [Nocardioides sp. AX2bis]